jgi:shikimate dehydrogenase
MSGEIFRAVFDITGMNGEFTNYNIEPADFDEQFPSLVKQGLMGLSVTIPYKAMVISYLDEIHPIAEAVGAVNSIALSDQKLMGFNTDCDGFAIALEPHSDRLKHGHALILGCGGGAKAAVYSLYANFEVRQFTILSRNQTRLDQFKLSLSASIDGLDLRTDLLTNGRMTHPERYDIIVNCTPLGGWNHPTASPLPSGLSWSAGRIYYDLNYNLGNACVAAARAAGLTAIDGSTMLTGQALRSLEIWTGVTVPFEEIHRAVFGPPAANQP